MAKRPFFFPRRLCVAAGFAPANGERRRCRSELDSSRTWRREAGGGTGTGTAKLVVRIKPALTRRCLSRRAWANPLVPGPTPRAGRFSNGECLVYQAPNGGDDGAERSELSNRGCAPAAAPAFSVAAARGDGPKTPRADSIKVTSYDRQLFASPAFSTLEPSAHDFSYSQERRAHARPMHRRGTSWVMFMPVHTGSLCLARIVQMAGGFVPSTAGG